MATQVSMPDGTTLNFPDGIPEEEMRQAAENYHSQSSQTQPQPGKLESATRGYLQGGSLGYGDEIQGGIAAAVAKLFGGDATKDSSLTDLYREGRGNVRAENAAAEKAHPFLYNGAQIAGSIPTSVYAAGKMPIPETSSKVANAVINGGLFSGAYGGGNSNADLTKGEIGNFAGDVLGNAALGGLAGGVLQGITSAAPVAFDKAKSFYSNLRMTPEEKAIDYVRSTLMKEGVNPQAVADRIQNASDTGIPLSIPEATDSLKLMNAQKIIAKGTSPGAKVIRDFDTERFTDAIPQAVQNAIKDISPNTSLDSAGKGAADTVDSAFNKVLKARSDKASPIYNEAFKTDLPQENFDKLVKDPVIADAISTMRDKPIYQKDLGSLPDNNYKVLQRLREIIGDKSSVDSREGATTASHLYNDSKAALTNEMSANNPLWDQANKIYSTDSKAIENLKSDTLGSLKDLNTGNYETAIPKIFNDTPEGITRSRNLIAGEDPQVWNDVLASHMQSNLDKIRDGGFRNLYNNLYGNSLVRQKFQAAMSPDQYQGFTKLMEGLKDSLKVNLSGSDTHFNQASQAEFNQEVGSGITQAAKSWYNIPGKIAEHFDQKFIEKNSEAIAKLFTSPNLANLAKDLESIKPESPEYFNKIGNFIAAESPALIAPATAPTYQTKQ